MIYENADEAIGELFQSLLCRDQTGLETSMRGSDFTIYCVYLMYYKCHKINPNRGGLHIDSPDWIKNKKTTINLFSKNDNKSFQYTVTVAWNDEEIGKYPERITKIKPFTTKYN